MGNTVFVNSSQKKRVVSFHEKMDAERQIRQMVNFILQEAREKASEIYVKTEHDFSLEKQ